MNPILGFVLAWLVGWLLTCFVVGRVATYGGKTLAPSQIGPICLLLLPAWPLFYLVLVGAFLLACGMTWSKPKPGAKP